MLDTHRVGKKGKSMRALFAALRREIAIERAARDLRNQSGSFLYAIACQKLDADGEPSVQAMAAMKILLCRMAEEQDRIISEFGR